MSQDVYVVVEHLRGQVSDISYVMLAAARPIAESIGGEVVAVLLGHDAQDLGENFAADRILYFDHPQLSIFSSSAYLSILSDLIRKDTPRVIFFGHTTIGSDVASGLSVRLDLPIVSQCLQSSSENGQIKLISKICGGKILAESLLADESTLVTVIPGGYKPEEGQSQKPPEIKTITPPTLEDLPITLADYIEPEVGDVDISKESVLVAIGRGIQTEDNIEIAEEIAQLLGGKVCASRPVVDQGWLPISRMVGKSGKSVKPKLYLALGISGAPEHVEGMSDSETIIAINIDPTAPIFDIAQYGAEIDLFDLVDELIYQLEEARG
jgi:electron transfer flavoprotein alpha subunit